MDDVSACYIAGSWQPTRGQDELTVTNPFTEEKVGTVRVGGAGDVNAAVDAGHEAWRSGVWSEVTLEERCAVIERMRAGLAARRADLIERAVTTLGQAISRARVVSNVDAPIFQAMDSIRAFTREIHRENRWGEALIVRKPIGVVAAICPWNAPTRTEIQKTIPALLSGCSVVLKPDPQTPYASGILAEVAAEAGLPAGVLNIVQGGAATGCALVRHPLISLVSFTGSSATGSSIGGVCGQELKPMVLELGGKSAMIILDDADLDTAIQTAEAANFGNAGQACIGLTRILVPRRLYAEVVDRLVERARAQVLGDPFEETTTMGPVVSRTQRDRIMQRLLQARAGGAKIATGGGRPTNLPRGWFVEPTVVVDADPSSPIAQEEIFGPVATVIPFDDEAHAVAIANNSSYGLHGAVFGKDVDRALSIARRLETGTVAINCYGLMGGAPFGGVKKSGYGREYGPEGFEAYHTMVAYALRLGDGSTPAPKTVADASGYR